MKPEHVMATTKKATQKQISKARQITPTTVKRLFALSGNQCAFPGCNVKIVTNDSDIIVSQICHIEAAETNGQRYNPSQTDDERRDFKNLILLCPTHHVVTNNTDIYKVDDLQKMKSDHEGKMLQVFSLNGGLNKYPSSLVTVINSISANDLISSVTPMDASGSFSIDKKIGYNDIKRHKPILDAFKIYQGRLQKIYEQIELAGSFKKDQLLININSFYLKAKGTLTDGTIDDIKTKADLIIDEVEKMIWEVIEKSNNLDAGVSFEAVQVSVSIILVDAFMRCKILEEPI